MHTIATIVPHIDYLEPFTVVTHCTLATIIPHIYYLEPFTVVTHPLLERANLKTFPVRAFLVASPSCTVWFCRCPIISFVFDTLRFSVCIHIRVRLLYQSTSRLLHILFCSLPPNPSSPTVSLALPSSHHLFCI